MRKLLLCEGIAPAVALARVTASVGRRVVQALPGRPLHDVEVLPAIYRARVTRQAGRESLQHHRNPLRLPLL